MLTLLRSYVNDFGYVDSHEVIQVHQSGLVLTQVQKESQTSIQDLKGQPCCRKISNGENLSFCTMWTCSRKSFASKCCIKEVTDYRTTCIGWFGFSLALPTVLSQHRRGRRTPLMRQRPLHHCNMSAFTPSVHSQWLSKDSPMCACAIAVRGGSVLWGIQGTGEVCTFPLEVK